MGSLSKEGRGNDRELFQKKVVRKRMSRTAG